MTVLVNSYLTYPYSKKTAISESTAKAYENSSYHFTNWVTKYFGVSGSPVARSIILFQ